MSSQKIPNNLVLYYYSFSPYARRVIRYLALRRIQHARCAVPAVMPREVLTRLNVAYRRIPLLSHGRDVYCDTRLILEHLDAQFPPSAEHPPITAETPEGKALCKLLIRYHADAGIFLSAVNLLPENLDMLKTDQYLKDRASLGLEKFTGEDRKKRRPEALTRLRDLFMLLEDLLADGRTWIVGGDAPSVADIEAVWTVHWLIFLPGALDSTLSEKHFPKVHAYTKRWDAETRRHMKGFGKQPALENNETTARAIRDLPLMGDVEEIVDEKDPTGFKLGDEVEVFPVDSGWRNKDAGILVKLTANEMVVRKQSEGKDIRIHVPRWGFRVQRRSTPASL